jgi:signal transduction histidine kinase
MPQTPSFVAASEQIAGTRASRSGASDVDPVIDAALALAEQKAFGVLWLDPDLRVVSAGGVLPDGLIMGSHVADCLIPLIGLDSSILALKTQSVVEPLRLANTAVMTNDGRQSRRFNIDIFWNEDRQRFLVLLGMIFMQGSPTAELDQEIRRRRLIEQDLAAKSAEYARINQQLEEFAYVISHDLNAPLRALRYLTGDIQTALATTATIDTDLLHRTAGEIASQTRRMSKMLIDLLEYSRIGRVHDAIESVDTRALIGDVMATLRPTTKLDLIVAGDWPTFDTAAAPLDVVLRNLIENAVKHHDLPTGRIEVTAVTDNRYIVFSIADDGRGIPEEWQQAIFEPFRKIDDAHHPESSGIGLALVKKTVVSLGGSIEVASCAPIERGTTFTVRWPLKLSNKAD